MEKQFITLLNATMARAEGLNAAWHKVIGYAVKKAHSDRENGLQYVQAALDAAPAGIRKAVASAFRQLNLNISALQRGQFRAEGVRNPKAQEKVFDRVKAGDIPDVVSMVDKLPKAKKEDTRAAADVAQDVIDRALARLKRDNPDAAAIFNDRMAGKVVTVETVVEKVVEKFEANVICVGDAEDILHCSREEIDAVVEFIMARRMGALKAA